MGERNNCAKFLCQELDTVITRLLEGLCVWGGGGGSWYIPIPYCIQSSSVVDPGGDNLPSAQFVQELALAGLHVPIMHWKHSEPFL